MRKKYGLTQQGCADLTAKTEGANFWTFQPYGGKSDTICWLRRRNDGRRTETFLVSGNRACGNDGK